MKVENYFERFLQLPEERRNLAEAALQVAADEYPLLKIQVYLDLLDSWGAQSQKNCRTLKGREKLECLNEFLFSDLKFQGNIDNYYDPKNSFLNEVMDRRTGIPVTLSVVYLEIAWQNGIDAAGVGLPGQFLVRILLNDETLYVDPFHNGNVMTKQECREFWQDITEDEMEFQEHFLSTTTKLQILIRILRNLKRIYLDQKASPKLLQIQNKLVLLTAESPEEIRDRGIVHYQMEAFKLAMKDFETYLSVAPEDDDSEVIRQYLEVLREYSSKLN